MVFQCVIIWNYYFNRYKEGYAEKQGKRHWASRYLMIVGCRLFVYRYPISKKQGNQNIPLNVIDLTNALVVQKSKNILSITTHREVRLLSNIEFSMNSVSI